MSGIAAKVRAGAWLALGALVALYLGFFRTTDTQEPVIIEALPPPAVAFVAPEAVGSEVIAVDVTLKARDRDTIAGSAGARYRNDVWVWEDGAPIAGSTPERLARTLSELEIRAFVQDDDPVKYGLADPVARAVLTERYGGERVVLIGAEGEPEADPEGYARPRYYATIEGGGSVYLVDGQALERIRDLVKERSRKAEKDAVKAERAAAMARKAEAGAP